MAGTLTSLTARPNGTIHKCGDQHGRFYRTTSARRPITLVIPPRSDATGFPKHESAATVDGHVVQIIFPAPLSEGELEWEQHGDVLDVDYRGQAFAYYHAFMVPADCSLTVERRDRAVKFNFTRAA